MENHSTKDSITTTKNQKKIKTKSNKQMHITMLPKLGKNPKIETDKAKMLGITFTQRPEKSKYNMR